MGGGGGGAPAGYGATDVHAGREGMPECAWDGREFEEGGGWGRRSPCLGCEFPVHRERTRPAPTALGSAAALGSARKEIAAPVPFDGAWNGRCQHQIDP